MGTLGTRARNGKKAPVRAGRTGTARAKLRERDALKDALEQQAATAEILKVIARSPSDVQPVFDTIVRSAVQLCGSAFGFVGRFDGEKLHLAAHHNFPRAALEVAKRTYPCVPDRSRGAGRSIVTKSVVLIEDIHRDPEYFREYGRKGGWRRVLAVPMMRDGVPLGTISLAWAEPGPIPDSQVELLRTFADQAVIAIENARLFNETKEALEQQTATAEILNVISSSPTAAQPVFEAIVQCAARLFAPCNVAIVMREGDVIVRKAAAGPDRALTDQAKLAGIYPLPFDPERSMTARSMSERRVLEISDTEAEGVPSMLKSVARAAGYRAITMVPLIREGEGIGVIGVHRPAPGFRLSPKQLALVRTFADQAVIAIENARLFNDTKEALERQTATAEILRVIAASPSDTQPVFDAIARSAQRLVGAHYASVCGLVDDSLHLMAHADAGANPAAEESLRKLFPTKVKGEGALGKAVLTGRPNWIADVETDAAYSESFRRGARARGYRSLLAVPMMRDVAAIGVIAVTRRDPGPFRDEQVRLLQTFADQAVIAIENVRLFNETKEALDQQTATAEILKVISRSPTDMQPVFQAIVESAARLVEPLTVVITMREGDLLQRKARAGPEPVTSEQERARLQSIWPLPVDPKVSISARAIVERRVVEVLDVQAEESEVARRIGQLGGHRSITVVPLMRESEAIGSIVLTTPEPGRKLSDKQLALVKTFADQAVIAIENVRLFKELQNTNANLRESLEQQTATGEILKTISSSATDVTPVFETIIRNAVRLGGAQFGTVFRLDGYSVAIGAHWNTRAEAQEIFRASFPQLLTDGSPFGRAMVYGRTVNVADHALEDFSPESKARAQALGSRGILAVPMLKDGRALGAIAIGRAEPGAFSDGYVSLVKTFADQAVIAIENVRLFNETKEALEQQTAISEVLRVISSSPADVQPVLLAVAERAARICEASDARIFLVEGEQLRHVAGFGDVPSPEVGETRPLDRRAAMGRAVIDRAPVHVEDVQVAGEEFAVSRHYAAKYGVRTILAAPLMRENKALGAIVLRRVEVRRFTDKQTALLKTFTDQAAIAIENVRLFNETKEALAQQKASAEVLGAVSSSIADTRPVFDKIAEGCQRLFASTLVGINLVGEDGLIHLASYHGPGREQFEKIFPIPVNRDSGTGLAILEGQVQSSADVETDPKVPEVTRRGCRALGLRSGMFAPIMWEGAGIGAIFVGRPVVGGFSEKETALLRSFADQAAIAIQNARLFREIQEKSAQLEVANKHKSDFLANMSHELRTPLNAIIGFSEVLGEGMFGELNEKQADYLRDIHESGKHLLSLINDILDLSKIEAGRMELELSTFDLRGALSNAMTLIRERAQRHAIELGLDVDPQLGAFEGDERKFKQIMLNLLSNAVKFTPDGGRVDVRARRENGAVEVAVKDTGIGIAPEDQALVFEEFRQVGRDRLRKAEGTGLGLALTKRFIELHGGAIRLESTPGKGSTFTVSLPIRN